MKHILKRGLALLCMLTLLVGVLPLSASATELGEFTVLSTTDMHGRCWDTNLLTGGSVGNSMLNVATAVEQIRSEKSNVILIDNGDTYQGTPVSSYQLSRQAAGLTTDPNPMALSLTEIRYDFSVLGNHEFNYGWDTMEEVRDYLCMAGVLTVTANLYYDGSDGVHAKGQNVFSPYILQTVTAGDKGYRVAIIGFENTDCPRWDVADNYPGIVFTHPILRPFAGQAKGAKPMKFTFTCKKIALNNSIKEYAEKKISKLDRYFPEEADAFVTFAVEKKNRCVVELTIRAANGTLFRAQEEDADGDMRGAIDKAVTFIDRRIRKNKTRLAKNLRADALVSDVPAEFDLVEDAEFDVVRTKRFTVKPMSTDEAILQMNLLGHSFYVFRNVDDNAICVVYTRHNGGYGLIETEE